MKRTFRVAIILIPVTVLLTGIGMWRHHYLKIINAEPEKVYKVPGQENNLSTDTNTTKVTLEKGEENTDAMTQRVAPEKMENIGDSPNGPVFGDIIEENLPPEAVAALRKYEEIQLTYPKVRRELIPLLKAWPVDWDAVSAVDERRYKLKQQRKDALEILSVYSDEAFNELQATIEREKNVERQIAELDREYKERQKVRQAERAERQAEWAEFEARHAEFKARWAETKARWAAADEKSAKSSKLLDRYMELSDTILTMPRKEQKQALEELNRIQNELNELNEDD